MGKPLRHDISRLTGHEESRPQAHRFWALTVDPDVQTRESLRSVLSAMRIGVMEAESGDQARELLRDTAADIALIEVNLPGQLGDVLATEIKKIGVTPVLMSESSYGLARARRTGFAMLPKPFTLRQAVTAIVLALPVA